VVEPEDRRLLADGGRRRWLLARVDRVLGVQRDQEQEGGERRVAHRGTSPESVRRVADPGRHRRPGRRRSDRATPRAARAEGARRRPGYGAPGAALRAVEGRQRPDSRRPLGAAFSPRAAGRGFFAAFAAFFAGGFDALPPAALVAFFFA